MKKVFNLFFLVFLSSSLLVSCEFFEAEDEPTPDLPDEEQPEEEFNYEEEGIASYYADRFEGRPTASGEIFHQDSLTAAHKTLPFGTRVLVRNKANGKELWVRINDRGPFVEGRIIDLSRRGAEELDFIQAGLAEVIIKAYLPNDDG